MPEALWTLLGVAIGAVLSGVFVVVAAILASKSADADREEARTERLFHARRVAYEEFQSGARLVVEAVWKAHREGAAQPDFDILDDVVRSLGTVRLYASPGTTDAAEGLLRTLDEYVASDIADAPSADAVSAAYRWADESLNSFAAAARLDLT
ncbi:hypothetical protein BHE97_06410 [Aeromicrobium sp. PE09-221]|uniref:hypothetical protein n=1 Tax=Aeromicrobium sp. PE09-221 TaxID=1898043 RepID=UPI000B3E9C84|nr:hypothetical protein [Aeromicrobium sp. PE09-221]OUZ11057.1 hypothetical protein BHE97_06410 [Aeromicrobium sp. PE09-221]